MEDLSKYVGLFVRRGSDLGMINAVHGNRLGFVWSDKTSWTAELVDVNDVSICESDDDCSAALNSSRQYYSYEVNSIRGRIAMKYKQDCLEVLVEMLNRCEMWLKRLED